MNSILSVSVHLDRTKHFADEDITGKKSNRPHHQEYSPTNKTHVSKVHQSSDRKSFRIELRVPPAAVEKHVNRNRPSAEKHTPPPKII
mmetsp:Transcript_18571/g.42459  ORF Transcript_18571/g.42459 Transcript_18571/m.42459 type:complete len:88 (-) Transcript_18571:43-306(-)